MEFVAGWWAWKRVEMRCDVSYGASIAACLLYAVIYLEDRLS